MLLSGLISKYKTICKENRRHLSEISKIEIFILLVMISAAIVYILNVIIIKENNVIALVIATLIFVITSVLENIIWYNRYGKRAEYYKNQHLQRVKQMLRAQGLIILTTASIYYIINIGEMPAGKQSKSRRDSLLPDWGQIITIEYYRMDDTLSREGYRGACIFDTGALSAPIS